MYSSLSCAVKAGTAADTYTDTLSFICGSGTDCSGISANGSLGTYGAYSMCSSTQQLGYVMGQHYSTERACHFDGAARTQSAAQPTGECKVPLSVGTSGSLSAASNTAPATSESSSNSGNLSAGAKTGLGVGVGVGAVVILAGTVAVSVLRRRRRAARGPDIADKDGPEKDSAVMLGNDSQEYKLEQRLSCQAEGRIKSYLPGTASLS